ncbi:MAG: cation diffusion facilitator family transporter [Leptospirales bacterium]
MHPHDHDHPHTHQTHSPHGTRTRIWLHRLLGHSHRSDDKVDAAMEEDASGFRALKISLIVLSLTSFLQLAIVALSGSVALLADALHNLADGVTSIPLWIAFTLIHRGATSRFTYGYGKTEDVAGILVVLLIFVSACTAVYESIMRFVAPEPLTHLGWVSAAAIVGFIGNETVAWIRIRTGRMIGSAALIADGQHSRIDGLTSLMVLIGVAGSKMGYPLLDPAVGIVIALVILLIMWNSAHSIWFRLLDAIEPEHLDRIRQAALHTSGVVSVSRIRARWIGHRITSEVDLYVDPDLSVRETDLLSKALQRTLHQQMPFLAEAVVRCLPAP